MEDLKDKLFQLCLSYIQNRVYTAETALAQAQEASNDDTKSSAGDKFETTREMMQQDIGRNKNLLADAWQNLKILESLPQASASGVIRNGSLVYTNHGIFYLSISAGQLHQNGQMVYAISSLSPVGQLLIGKKVNEKFIFNQKEYLIDKIL